MENNKELTLAIEELKTKSLLHNYVVSEIIEKAINDYRGSYTARIFAYCDDLNESNIVDCLIYDDDRLVFFKRFSKDIQSLLLELCEGSACFPWELLRDFDKTDLFCQEKANQKLLALFGYEEVISELENVIENVVEWLSL